MRILLTGGCGFIGSAVIRRIIRATGHSVLNVDKMTYAASEAALENSIESMRIHGAYGYSKEYDIERLYRDAPLTCIGEGTNEMQRIIIAKQWIKRSATV